jgi:hypothetical protein
MRQLGASLFAGPATTMAIDDTTGEFGQPIEVYRGIPIYVRMAGTPRRKEFYGDLPGGRTLKAETQGTLKATIDIAVA